MGEKTSKFIDEFKSLDNGSRNEFLAWIYDEHFNNGVSDEVFNQMVQIWKSYQNGELIDSGRQ